MSSTEPTTPKSWPAPYRMRLVLWLATALLLTMGCRGGGDASPGATPAESASPVVEAGQPSPTFNLTGPDGSVVSFLPAESEGELHLLVFWSYRFDPNADLLLKRSRELHERYAPQGLSIFGVTYDEEPGGVRNFLEQHPIPFPTAIGSRTVADRFELKAVPTALLVDSEGRIIDRWEGHFSTDELAQKISGRLPGRSGNSEG